jgi:hypothetical protein
MKTYTYENDFNLFVNDNDGSRILRIDEEMFYYWLEVLPPVYMGREQIVDGLKIHCSFGFAEGREPVVDFWSEKSASGEKVFYCKRSNRLNKWG